MKNSYYEIACNDMAYLEAVGDTGYYNQPAALCQQVVEKLLKGLIEQLNMKDLAYLTNYYFDTRYPGPDYHEVSKEDYEECKQMMYAVKVEVDRIRQMM